MFVLDTWLTQTAGLPCYRLSPKEMDAHATGELVDAMAKLSAGQRVFCYAKLETQHVAGVRVLEQAGFAVVDTNVVLAWSPSMSSRGAPLGVRVADAEPQHFDALQNVAATCFRYSRFHLDPLFPDETADFLKRKWVESYCFGRRGATLYAATVDGKVAGFLAVLEAREERSAVIDLIGVAQVSQGLGVGSALVGHFVAQWRDRADRLLVGTQVANSRSLAFYEQLGFRTTGSAYVLHAHYEGGKSMQ